MKIKHLLLSLLFIVLGLACMLIENASSYIDAQGMWHEYFCLILVAWLLVITGIVVGGIGIFKDYKHK